MKSVKNMVRVMICLMAVITATSCNDILDEPQENTVPTAGTDYTNSDNMILPLLGAYAEFATRGWEDPLLISVRGDDVNAGGLGDQIPYSDTDYFSYNKTYWMYEQVWKNFYGDIIVAHSAMEETAKYKEFAPNAALADQYIAEAKVLRAYMLLTLSRIWGDVFITTSADPSDLFQANVSTKAEVMQHISDQMDEAIPLLPDLRPNQRIDIPGGVTRYTALAIKALANQELGNYDVVASATNTIIASNKFTLDGDFYELFKLDGKLNNENLLEIQFSDFGSGSGTQFNHLYAPFGPENWYPAVNGAASGWGFYEPSLKWIKFMIARGETVRLETSVLFTPRGVAKLQEDTSVPAWITNGLEDYAPDPSKPDETVPVWVTRDGDRLRDFNRAMFSSGKHYLPSNQLTPGRTDYGSNKNMQIIRYSEILLMYAEAVTRGGSEGVLTADEAVNLVRNRAGLGDLAGVTTAQVMDEKYAELAMEWGIRYYDLIRSGVTAPLSYDGRTFSIEKTYLPYPQGQVDILPILGTHQVEPLL